MTRSEERFDFEEALKELETLVERLGREELGLDEAIELFERGVERFRAASRWLDEASGRVEELIASAEGSLETREFEPDRAATDGDGEGGSGRDGPGV